MTSTSTNKANDTEQKFAWVYLINLGFYFIPLFINEYPAWKIGLSLAVLIPFIASYFWAYKCPRNKAIYPILSIVALATLITPINPGSLSLYTFAGFFIGFFYPLRQVIVSFLALFVLLAALNHLSGFNQYYFPVYGSLLISAVGLFGVVERRRVETKRLKQQSNDEIAQMAKIVERERIARDLHDVMGHSLSSIILKAELAEKLIEKQQPEQAQSQLNELAIIARDSLSQIRRTVSNYKHTGLDATLGQLCDRLRDKGISTELIGEITPLPARVESQLILILTELISNMLRYSQAKHCQIIFEQDVTQIKVVVVDQAEVAMIIEGNGIKGIRERVHDLNGQYQYQLAPYYQTNICLPLSQITPDAQ